MSLPCALQWLHTCMMHYRLWPLVSPPFPGWEKSWDGSSRGAAAKRFQEVNGQQAGMLFPLLLFKITLERDHLPPALTRNTLSRGTSHQHAVRKRCVSKGTEAAVPRPEARRALWLAPIAQQARAGFLAMLPQLHRDKEEGEKRERPIAETFCLWDHLTAGRGAPGEAARKQLSACPDLTPSLLTAPPASRCASLPQPQPGQSAGPGCAVPNWRFFPVRGAYLQSLRYYPEQKKLCWPGLSLSSPIYTLITDTSIFWLSVPVL